MFKRIISMLLVVVMLTGMLPLGAFAQEGTSGENGVPETQSTETTEFKKPETPDTETGDTETGDTETGDTETGDTETGDTETGDTETGDTEIGDTGTGDTETGDTETGDTETGDTETGDTETGDTETGDTETGDTETEDTETEDTETGDTETEDTETEDTETEDTETEETETDAPTLEQVVAMYEALPDPSSITAYTTEEEKDTIFALLVAAEKAYEALNPDDMDVFDMEYWHLLVKAQELNYALIADYPDPLADDFYYKFSRHSANATLYYSTDGTNLRQIAHGTHITLDRYAPVAFYADIAEGYTASNKLHHRAGSADFYPEEDATWSTGIYTALASIVNGNLNLGSGANATNFINASRAAASLLCEYEFHYSDTNEKFRYREFKILAEPVEIRVEYDGNSWNASNVPEDNTIYRHPNVLEEQYKNHPDTITVGVEAKRNNYTFVGWEINGKVYQPGDTVNIADIWTTASSTSVTYTFKAVWAQDLGNLQVTKNFQGIPAEQIPKNFQIEVKGDSYTNTLTIATASSSGDGRYTWNLNKIPTGRYRISESGPYAVGYDFQQEQSTMNTQQWVSKDSTTTAALENVYTPKNYTITWCNDDGSVLDTKQVAYGQTPAYSGTPQSAKMQGGTVTFTGWTPEVAPVTGDATYTATYSQTFTVTYRDYNNEELKKETGITPGAETPSYTPESTKHPNWRFKGWTPAVAQTVTADATYTAVWDVPYTVEHYKQENGGYPETPSETENLTGSPNQQITAQQKSYPGYVADTNAEGTLTSGTLGEESVTLKLYYKQSFTVTWRDRFNPDTVFETDSNLEYGTEISFDAETQPSKATDGFYYYTFDGYWSENADGTGKLYKEGDDKKLYEVQRAGENQSEVIGTVPLTATGNLTLYAQYTPHKRHHTGTVEVILNGQYDSANHTVIGGTKVSIGTVKSGVQSLVLKKDGESFVLRETVEGSGIYQNTQLEDGVYQIYYKLTDGTEELVSTQQVDIKGQDRTRYIFFYSVTYDLAGGTGGPANLTSYYRTGDTVNVDSAVPTKDGFVFKHWLDDKGTEDTTDDVTYQPSTAMANTVLTAGINRGYTLKAVWEAAAVVRVKVTMEHNSNESNQPMEIVLTKKTGETQSMEVANSTRTVQPEGNWGNEYTYLYGDMPIAVEEIGNYSAHVELPGYKTVSISPITKQDNKTENGCEVWQVEIKLKYDPEGFDLSYTVQIDGFVKSANPKLVPQAVDVKVTCWNGDSWEPIEEHKSRSAQVLITEAENGTLSGTGTTHVWGYKNNDKDNPYLYRMDVVGIDFADDSYYMTVTDTDNDNVVYYSTEKGFFPDGAYTGIVSVENGGQNCNGNGSLVGAIKDSGDLKAVINLQPYTVVLDPNGGAFPDGTTVTNDRLVSIANRFTVPALDAYTPTKDGSTFEGWYVKQGENFVGNKVGSNNYTIKDLVEEETPVGGTLTLYAKWSENITVTGRVAVSAMYQDHALQDHDLLKEVTVLLQRQQDNGYTNTEHSQKVTIDYADNATVGVSTANYSFTNLPSNETYRVAIISPNFLELYQNEPESLSNSGNYESYLSTDYIAEVGTDGPNEAVVNMYLAFNPRTFDMGYAVNASAIGEAFRPQTVNMLVLCDEYPEKNRPYTQWGVISQHVVDGVEVGQTLGLRSDGTYGIGIKDENDTVVNYVQPTESVWQYHTTGYAYDYAIRLQSWNGTAYSSGTAPFTVSYSNIPVNVTNRVAAVATLQPKTYAVYYHTNDDGVADATGTHTWSFATKITRTASAEGKVFAGWYDSTGNRVETIAAAVCENTNLYARWEEDADKDGIPDSHQRTVVFKVENGQWDNETAEPVSVKVTLMKGDQSAADGTATLTAEDIPAAGQKPNDRFKAAVNPIAPWNQSELTLTIDADSELEYTYSYDMEWYDQFVLNGGTWTVGEDTHTGTVEFLEGYTRPDVAPVLKDHVFMGWTETAVNADHIRMRYRAQWEKDVIGGENGGDGILDEYQKKVTFRIENGTWDGTSKEDIVRYVTLKKGDELSLEGQGTLDIPDISEAKADEGYKGGSWITELPETVTGTDPVIYTYRYAPIVYKTYSYVIEHYTQNLDGTYTLMAEDTVGPESLPVELNLAGTGFEGNIPVSVNIPRKTYDHFILDEADSNLELVLTFETPEHHVLKLIYDRDRHTVSYDLNGGTAAPDTEETYGDETLICGVTVTAKAAPVRTGYRFDGWKKVRANETQVAAIAQEPVETLYQPGDTLKVGEDICLIAQWTANPYPYRIEYYFDGVMDEACSVTKEAPFDTTVSITDGTAEGVEKQIQVGEEPAIQVMKQLTNNGKTYVFSSVESTLNTIAVENNVIRVFYLLDNWDGGDGTPDKDQVKLTYQVDPEDKGDVETQEKTVLDVQAGKTTLPAAMAVPVEDWAFEKWTIREEGASSEQATVLGTEATLEQQEISVTGGKAYVVAAKLVPKTTKVEPAAAAYFVEHYKWDSASDSYVLADTEIFTGELNATVTAQPKTYPGYTVNPLAPDSVPSGTVTMPALENGQVSGLLRLSLYYDSDTGDNVPDRYQKQVTFRIVNGKWWDRTNEDIVVYLTLTDENGNWDPQGSAELKSHIPMGMWPNRGYARKGWDVKPPATVSGTDPVTYTYRCIYVADRSSPMSGDTSGVMQWAAVLLASGAGLLGVIGAGKKRRKNRK